MARNNFKSALNHIKSTKIDEKIQRLNESPTNNTSNVYDLSPSGQRYGRYDRNPEQVFYANADGSWPSGVPGTPGERTYTRPIGYWEEGPGATPSVQHDVINKLDFSYNTQIDDPRQTTSLIDEDTGRVFTDLPPNSRSFILGPLVDLYFHNHGYDNRTSIGYIQKDTREFVLLGYIPGTWGDDDNGDPIRADGFEGGGSTRVWNGLESSFVATNPSFTFEMLQWHHDRLKEGKYVKNVAYFNSGGVPVQTGRGGTGQPSGTYQGNVSGTPVGGDAGNNGNADLTHGTGTSNGEPTIGTQQDAPISGNAEDAGFPWETYKKALEAGENTFNVLMNMSPEQKAELAMTALNIGLDIAAIAGILFPEPGTTAAGLARMATRLGLKVGSTAMKGARAGRAIGRGVAQSARNRAARGALNPFGQRTVRSGAAGRQRVRVYSGRSGTGPMVNAPGKTVFATPTQGRTGRRVAGGFAQKNQATKGIPGAPERGSTVYSTDLPQRYIDKYGSRSLQGFRQVKMSKSAADKAFKKAVGGQGGKPIGRRVRREEVKLLELFLTEVATPTPVVDTPPVTQGARVSAQQTADATADKISQNYSKEEVAEIALDAEAASEYEMTKDTNIQELLDKAPGTLTPYEEQILLDAGFDDYVNGGTLGTDLLGDLATLGLSFAAAKAILPLLIKVGGNFVDLIKHEHGVRAITDAAMETFRQTGQMPPWYHWAFWKQLPPSILTAYAKIAKLEKVPFSVLTTEGTPPAKFVLHYILNPSILVTFFQLLVTGDQSGAEDLLRNSITDTVKKDFAYGDSQLLWEYYNEIGSEAFMELAKVYESMTEGLKEKSDRLNELSGPEYAEGIQSQIDEIESQYKGASWVENGVRIYASSDWGGQFTKQSFESSGQSFEEYDALREQIGFFNGERGPDEYGRYQPVGWWQLTGAVEKGHKPEQFTGIAHEIVSLSYKMDEISSNPNFPGSGTNIYDNEADYNEAVRLQDEYKKLYNEYVNLWEGPGGYNEVSGKAYAFITRSEEMMEEDAREASKRKQELQSELDGILKERNELVDEVNELTEQMYMEMIIDYMMQKPNTEFPSYFETSQGLPYTDEDDAFDNPYYTDPVPDLDDDSDFDPSTFDYAGGGNAAQIAALVAATAKRKEEEEKMKKNITASFKKSGQLISEDRKKLLREIKQPLNEVGGLQPQKLKNYRPNFKGRYVAQNTPDVTASKEANDMVRVKNAAGQTWREADKYWGGYESQERANVIYDHVGHGQLYWDEIVAHNQGKKTSRDREIQEELNKKYALIAEKELTSIAEQETLNAPKDPLFKKVRNKLKDKIDYRDKPSKLGYPNLPPKEQDQGYHPEYGEKKDYYKKLDPHSADAMPETGNLDIDDTVEKQKTLHGLYLKHQRTVNGTLHMLGKPNS